MNVSSTLGTALLRGAYQAVGSFLLVFLTALQLDATGRDAAITAGIATLWSLGFRGVGEGLADRSRQVEGEVRPGDVQPGSAGRP